MSLSNIFRPKWKHSNSFIRLEAVKKISNSKKLRMIYKKTDDDNIKYAVAVQLDDKELLKEIGENASDMHIKYQAAKGIMYEKVLVEVAKNSYDDAINAVELIKNQSDLEDIVKTSISGWARLEAAKKLNDNDLLIRIAKYSEDIYVRCKAAILLEDEYLLANISCYNITNDSYREVRNEAETHLYLLLEEIKSNKSWDRLSTFIMNLKIEDSMLNMNSAELRIKIKAFLLLDDGIVDKELLSHLSKHDFELISKSLVDKLFDKISKSGWEILRNIVGVKCEECNGTGGTQAHVDHFEEKWSDYGFYPCNKCNGDGKIHFRKIQCKRKNQTVNFEIPTHK